MPQWLNVNPESLVASGALVDGHSQTIFAAHSAADEQVESALLSWAGQSQAAMAAKSARWQSVTSGLATRLYRHAEGLRISGVTFAEMDHRDAQTLASVSRRPGSAS